MRLRVFLVVLWATMVPALRAAKGNAPAWLQSVAAVETPAVAKDAKAVVLLDESVRQVAPDGKVAVQARWAVRILKLDGRDFATASVPYNADFQKISAFNAWLLSPDGRVRPYARKEAIDLALNMDQVYTNTRLLALSAVAEVEAGAVFAFAWTMTESSIFSQDRWSFQSTIPVLTSRVTYELPAGWTANAATLGWETVAPVVQNQHFTWELRNLPAIPSEPWGPPASDLAAGLAIDITPAAKSAARTRWRTFASWQEVSTYMVELHDSRAVPDPAITARTAELIANATTPWEKIRAIGRFVQGINYASIQLGTGRGGGYTPNAAADVFKRKYGDCKDKSVLMRAMLRVAGIQSYSTIACAQERREIFSAWPSPQQFDHCIVAIAVDENVDSPAVITHPDLGRLLIFDPTSTATPPGELTYVQQGSHVLIGAGTAHDLVQLPFPAPAQNGLVRHMEASMDAAGSINAVVTESATGSAAAVQRGEYRAATAAEYSRIVEAWIGRGARAARVSTVEPKDRIDESGAFELRVEFAARNYAQTMGGQLLVFKPAIVPRRVHTAFTETKRVTPVLLEPHSYEETIVIELPKGFVVDELPPPVELTRPFGTYTLAGEVQENSLHFRRTYLVQAARIPVERYDEVRSFFEGINRAEQTPVVLKRN